MAGAVVVVGASMAACGGSSATSAKDFCTNLNNASKTISSDLGGNAPPKATLQKDAKTLNDLAGSAPQQLKKPLNDVAGFLKDAESLAAGGTPDSATVQRLTAEGQRIQPESQDLGNYVNKNCKSAGSTPPTS